MATTLVLSATCISCDTEHEIEVRYKDYIAWRDGALIQNVMPYLTAGQRELLISQTCEKCFMEGDFRRS